MMAFVKVESIYGGELWINLDSISLIDKNNNTIWFKDGSYREVKDVKPLINEIK